MPPFADKAFDALARTLTDYRQGSTVAQIAGLLTVPTLQPYVLRIELLVHLAVIHCSGQRDPSPQDVTAWLTDYLDATPVALLEDPPEDVFVSNVRTRHGNHRIFEGLWDSNDYFAQQLVDLLSHGGAPRQCGDLIAPITALLTLSDTVVKRLNLSRWHSAPSSSSRLQGPSASQYARHAQAVTFGEDDLSALGLTSGRLEPFVLREEDCQSMVSEALQYSTLERRPLVSIDGTLIFALPTAASVAIRRFTFEKLKASNHRHAFANAVAAYQARETGSLVHQELGKDAKLLELPTVPLAEDLPRLSPWLIEHDTNRYLHVVLLHDSLDDECVDDLTCVTRFSDDSIAAVHSYVKEIAERSLSQPSCHTGDTLIIVGGLGPQLRDAPSTGARELERLYSPNFRFRHARR